MRYRRAMISRVSAIALPCLIFFIFFPGFISSAVVTLKSVEIYNTHQWVPRKTAIYFQCSGENKISLPDVQEANVLYSFRGEESWQPLTELLTQKCKRCGIYEDLFMSGHTFEEWELCSSDFAAPDGNYTRFKEDEFEAVFQCKECLSLDKDSPPDAEESGNAGGRKHHIATILITVAAVVVVVFASAAAFKYWQKRKRQQEQARFLKLFEEDDDMEDELGLKEML